MKLKSLWLQSPQITKYRIRRGDLAPDGVLIRIDWSKFVPGSSFFVPCINTLECVRQIVEECKLNDWSVEIRMVVEWGRWGVRVWRIT